MNLRSSVISFVAASILACAVAGGFPAASSPATKVSGESKSDELRKLTDDLQKLGPVIARLEKMQGVMAIARYTSPTLEKLDRLLIKADLVERLDALLARVEKIEPMLRSLEQMQHDATERRRKESGIAANKIEKWSGIFDRLQARLDALEKRTYTPAALDDPATRRDPIEQRLRALEERQQTLTREIEALRRDNQRLRRQQRDEGL